MHFVYILYSPFTDKYYIGESVNAEGRQLQHNNEFYPTSSTRFAKDWEIKRQIPVENPQQARKVEQYIKGMKSKHFLNNLCKDPEFYGKFKKRVKEKFNISVLD